jgi:hypothetical protein
VLPERLEDAAGVRVAQENVLRSMIVAFHAGVSAAHMKHRQRDQDGVVGSPMSEVSGERDPQRGQDVCIGQLRALRATGGAGGIKLYCDVVGPDRNLRVRGALAIPPCFHQRKAFGRLVDDDDMAEMGQLAVQGCHRPGVFGGSREHRGAGVVENEGDLRLGQAPVNRGHDGVGLGGAEIDFKESIGVPAEIGDAVLRLHAEVNKAIRDPVGVGVELAIRDLPALELAGRPIRPAARVDAGDIGDRLDEVVVRRIGLWTGRWDVHDRLRHRY